MILGIGADILAVSRVAEAIRRRPRFLNRVLTESECAEFSRRGFFPPMESSANFRSLNWRAAAFVAKRFAAKEALAKALGIGFRAPVLLSAIGVANNSAGAPDFYFSPSLSQLMSARGIVHCRLSLADDGGFAFASVVLEG